MTNKRRYFILSAVIVTLAAVGSVSLIAFLYRQESLLRKSKSIQTGMTPEQVEAVMGRASDRFDSTMTRREWFPGNFALYSDEVGFPRPGSGSFTGDDIETWSDDDGVLVVHFDKNGTVDKKEFYPGESPKVKVQAFFGL
jgi:hypothetical protein